MSLRVYPHYTIIAYSCLLKETKDTKTAGSQRSIRTFKRAWGHFRIPHVLIPLYTWSEHVDVEVIFIVNHLPHVPVNVAPFKHILMRNENMRYSAFVLMLFWMSLCSFGFHLFLCPYALSPCMRTLWWCSVIKAHRPGSGWSIQATFIMDLGILGLFKYLLYEFRISEGV